MLGELRRSVGDDILASEYDAVVTKALLVHGAAWGTAERLLRTALSDGTGEVTRAEIGRFLGYGALDPERALYCTDQRATLIGCGSLPLNQAHLYTIPLPPGLSGQQVWRRLTLTLAWFTPINPRHQAYRVADLWFNPPPAQSYENELLVGRRGADARAVRRGTVQHELLEGESAVAFADGHSIQVQVNCRQADAAKPSVGLEIPYALIVSLEVTDTTRIPIYEEIESRIRIRPAVQVRPTV